jgi:hypothetical protein
MKVSVIFYLHYIKCNYIKFNYIILRCVLHLIMVYRVAEVVLCHENAHMLHVVVVCMVFEDVLYQHMLLML